MVQTGQSGAFIERSADITDGVAIRGVTMSPENSNIAYAFINGLYAGEKVYKTTNRGVNWINISGNIPNVPDTRSHTRTKGSCCGRKFPGLRNAELGRSGW
jgi:hypothetical protein